MGLKKNSPGCNCCATPVCLNVDTTEYTGFEVSGLAQYSVSLEDATATSYDPASVYLWAASTSPGSGCSTPPSSWRLGQGSSVVGCCTREWIQRETGRSDTNITMPSGLSSEVMLTLDYTKTEKLTAIITTTSLRLIFENSISYSLGWYGTGPDVNANYRAGTALQILDSFTQPPGTQTLPNRWSVTNMSNGGNFGWRVSAGNSYDLTKTNSGAIASPFQQTKTPAASGDYTMTVSNAGGTVSTHTSSKTITATATQITIDLLT